MLSAPLARGYTKEWDFGRLADIAQYKNAMVEAIQEMEEKDIARKVIKYNEEWYE